MAIIDWLGTYLWDLLGTYLLDFGYSNLLEKTHHQYPVGARSSDVPSRMGCEGKVSAAKVSGELKGPASGPQEQAATILQYRACQRRSRASLRASLRRLTFGKS